MTATIPRPPSPVGIVGGDGRRWITSAPMMPHGGCVWEGRMVLNLARVCGRRLVEPPGLKQQTQTGHTFRNLVKKAKRSSKHVLGESAEDVQRK